MSGFPVTCVVLPLSLMCTFLPPCSAETMFTGVLNNYSSVVTDLASDAKTYLMSLVGEKAVETSIEWVLWVVVFLKEEAAGFLNVIMDYITKTLAAMGINVKLPFYPITAEGVVCISQGTLMALIGYWQWDLVLRLVEWAKGRALWLVSLGSGLAQYGSNTNKNLKKIS